MTEIKIFKHINIKNLNNKKKRDNYQFIKLMVGCSNEQKKAERKILI